MTEFIYRGRDKNGTEVSAVLEAASRDSAVAKLLAQSITPLDVKEHIVKVDPLQLWLEKIKGKPKVEATELIMFSRQMYTINKAGIPLMRGLQGLSQSITHPTLKEVLEEITGRLEAGVALSVAMADHPKIFNNLYINIVNVGESTGKLEDAFLQLAEYMERDENTVKNVKAALRYPTFVVIAIAAAMVIVNIWVIPAFAKMFDKFGSELPMPTKILLGTSSFFINYWPYMLVVLVGGIYGMRHFLKTEKGQLWWGEYRFKLPVVGDILERASMARYARSFSLMLSAGVPLTQALHLCSRAIDNLYLHNKIQAIRLGIEKGESLIRTHYNSGMFTPLVLQMIAVGEESGQVETLLKEVAGFYEREVDYDLETVSARIEPILLVVMAGFVLILALGIFLPMWNMASVQGA